VACASLALLGCSTMARDLLQFNQQAFFKRVNQGVERGATEVFDNKIVEKEWAGWLERAFAHTQTHNSLLYLLVNGIQDNRFVQPVTKYGLDLVETAFTSKAVEQASGQMIYDVLCKEPRVVRAAYELCCWYVQDQRAIDLASQIMCNVHLRSDVCDIMSWQVACGSFDGVQTDEFRVATYNGGLNAILNPAVGQSAKHAYVFRPLANTMTLGLYNSVINQPSAQ
jgi:hypothetical protein